MVEEVAGTISRALVDNHGVRPVEHARACRAHHRFGRLALGRVPQSHLGAVDERVGVAAQRVGCLVRSDGYGAVALRYLLIVARDAYVDHFRFLFGEALAQAVEQFGGIRLECAVIHRLDSKRRFLRLRDDNRVETHLVHQLEPSHVEL